MGARSPEACFGRIPLIAVSVPPAVCARRDVEDKVAAGLEGALNVVQEAGTLTARRIRGWSRGGNCIWSVGQVQVTETVALFHQLA